MRFSGSFVPLITPFDRKKRLDKKALEKLIDWHISEGTDGIVCSATTGEGPTLNNLERKQIAEICISTSAKRVPIIVATGTHDTRGSVHNTEIAQKLGADGCLTVTPYYNKPSQEGCILHFKEIAKVGLPQILYNNPGRSIVKLEAETILELARTPNIVAIKESSHDLKLVQRIHKAIDVFSGDDDITFAMMLSGAVGSIATSANVIPKGWKKMLSLCQRGEWAEAEILAKKYLSLINALFQETNPQGVKFALSLMGMCSGTLRLPMIPVKVQTQEVLKRELFHLALPHFFSLQRRQNIS